MTQLRWLISCFLTIFLANAAIAQDDAVRAQVAAATSDAISQMRVDILANRISPQLSVGQFLDKTESIDALNQTIERAEQIGGPRWIDDQTCQVKLEISGARVAYTLVSAAAAHPKRSPIPAAVLEEKLSDWKDRTFTATGTSISAARLQVLRPADVGDAWTTVSDDARRQAVADARQDAVQHVMESIRPVELAPNETVGDLLAHEKAHQEIYRWLDSRPVTDVQFKDNLQVELIVSTPSDDLADVVINSGQSVGTTLPTDPQRMEIVKREFARRIAIAIGRASVKPINEKISTTRPAAIVLPQQPPAWIGQLIESEAVAQPKASKLRTKNAAEIKASEILRDRIDSLKLTPTLSIGEAAAHDPQVTEAIDRAMMRARVFKVDYRADDSVMVRMMIDSRDLWYELCQIGNQ